MSLLVAGTIAIDHVKTPVAEENNLLGGSASYASLAASFFTHPVHLVGIIGKDFPQDHLDLLVKHGITLEGVERSEHESFTWTGEYHDDMNSRTTHKVGLNVLENWQPQIPLALSGASTVVLANMSPDNQMTTLAQCMNAAFVVADTMDLWISIANERLHDVLKRLDLLVINESEAKEFTGVSNVIVAGDLLMEKGPRHVIIKLGEHGALLFGPGGEFFRVGAYPLRAVVDPTGAGDCFLGGLAGYLVSQKVTKPTFSELKTALVYGTVMASFACQAFSTKALVSLTMADIEARVKELHQFTSL